MRKTTAVVILYILCPGCGPEFEIRKDPDLLRLDPRQVNRLQDIRIEPNYVPRVSDRSGWKILTLLLSREALTDGDLISVASSSDEHRRGEWVFIDLGCDCHFQNVRQLHPSDGGEPPLYRIDTADGRGFPYTLQFVGSGKPGVSTATFPRAVTARFIRITIVEDSAKPWSIAELEVD